LRARPPLAIVLHLRAVRRDKPCSAGGPGLHREDDRPVFIGQVGLAGKVIAETQGWRAEKARIVRLFVPFQHYRYVAPLEALYRVPVVLDNTLFKTPTFDDTNDRPGGN
jgi:hypothetical protein